MRKGPVGKYEGRTAQKEKKSTQIVAANAKVNTSSYVKDYACREMPMTSNEGKKIKVRECRLYVVVVKHKNRSLFLFCY